MQGGGRRRGRVRHVVGSFRAGESATGSEVANRTRMEREQRKRREEEAQESQEAVVYCCVALSCEPGAWGRQQGRDWQGLARR